jgi:3-phosphoshikimate 1-carboxyvinyltransferase
MNFLIRTTQTLQGKVTVPGSKSQTIRAILFALLAKGESVLHNLLDSDDTRDAIQACEQLGAVFTPNDTREKNMMLIKSAGLPLQSKTSTTIHTGNSGITTRFLMPLLGFRQNPEPIILDCSEQMRARPIDSLVNALKHLGLDIKYLKNINQLPISISGNIIGGETEVDGLTSQYLSALLIALPLAPKDSIVIVKDLHERPYMEMTLQSLDKHKIIYKHTRDSDTNKDIFYITANQSYQPSDYSIPGDFSSASYLIAAGVLLKGKIQLYGLELHDPQGDKRLINILQSMGANIQIESDHLLIQGNYPLKGIRIDANDIPDLLPTLAVIGTQAEGKTEIYNVKQARIKETDRIHSMTEGLRRMGAQIDEHDDGMTVYHSTLHGAHVNGFEDHRTVMALSIAGMLATDMTIIEGSEAVNKTFPSFISLMRSLGANMEEQL